MIPTLLVADLLVRSYGALGHRGLRCSLRGPRTVLVAHARERAPGVTFIFVFGLYLLGLPGSSRDSSKCDDLNYFEVPGETPIRERGGFEQRFINQYILVQTDVGCLEYRFLEGKTLWHCDWRGRDQ